jgi:hypothetical protein
MRCVRRLLARRGHDDDVDLHPRMLEILSDGAPTRLHAWWKRWRLRRRMRRPGFREAFERGRAIARADIELRDHTRDGGKLQ